MAGFVVAEHGHVVNILAPKDINGTTATTQAFSLENWAHATIIIQLGVTAAAPTSIILYSCADNTGSAGTATAIPFNYYTQLTAGQSNDVLSTRNSIAATGITSVTANDNVFYVIEVDASELVDGQPYLDVQIVAPASSILASAVAILSGGRFQQAASPTVTA